MKKIALIIIGVLLIINAVGVGVAQAKDSKLKDQVWYETTLQWETQNFNWVWDPGIVNEQDVMLLYKKVGDTLFFVSGLGVVRVWYFDEENDCYRTSPRAVNETYNPNQDWVEKSIPKTSMLRFTNDEIHLEGTSDVYRLQESSSDSGRFIWMEHGHRITSAEGPLGERLTP